MFIGINGDPWDDATWPLDPFEREEEWYEGCEED